MQKWQLLCTDKAKCVKGECQCVPFGYVPGPIRSHGLDDDKKVNNEVRCKTKSDCAKILICMVGKQVCKNGVCKCVGHIGHENEGRGGIY